MHLLVLSAVPLGKKRRLLPSGKSVSGKLPKCVLIFLGLLRGLLIPLPLLQKMRRVRGMVTVERLPRVGAKRLFHLFILSRFQYLLHSFLAAEVWRHFHLHWITVWLIFPAVRQNGNFHFLPFFLTAFFVRRVTSGEPLNERILPRLFFKKFFTPLLPVPIFNKLLSWRQKIP